jgi:hypothetical protein
MEKKIIKIYYRRYLQEIYYKFTQCVNAQDRMTGEEETCYFKTTDFVLNVNGAS